jgi:guanosine-3',5'-bis(diphosphate) 3'-pyrophosphohydrolase
MDSARAGPLTGVIDALQFAADAHRDQRRKDRVTPYINHPIELVRLLAVEAGIHDRDVLVAAALHDYLEDCCGGPGEPTLEEGRKLLRQRFGERVLACVEAVSDDKSLPKEERKRLQVEGAAALPHDARLVKLADKTANLRDLIASPPVGWPVERRAAYFEWARSVVDRIRGTHPGLEALFDEAYALKPGWR